MISCAFLTFHDREIVKILSEKCHMSCEDVMERYEAFQVEHPEGEITKEKFLAGKKNTLMAESLFRVFDEDNSGALNFFEYLQVTKNVMALDLR